MKNKIIAIMKELSFGDERRGDLVLFESNFEEVANKAVKLFDGLALEVIKKARKKLDQAGREGN